MSAAVVAIPSSSWMPKVCLTLAVKDEQDFSMAHKLYDTHSFQSLYQSIECLAYNFIFAEDSMRWVRIEFTVAAIENNGSITKICICALIVIGSIAAILTAPTNILAWSVALIATSLPFVDDFFANRLIGNKALQEYISQEHPAYPAGEYIVDDPALLEQLIQKQRGLGTDLLNKREVFIGSTYDPNSPGPSLHTYIDLDKQYDIFSLLITNTLDPEKRRPILVDYFTHLIPNSSNDMAALQLIETHATLAVTDFNAEEQQCIWSHMAAACTDPDTPKDVIDQIHTFVKTLKNKGFDINVTDEDGDTVLDTCDSKWEKDDQALLSKWGARPRDVSAS